MNADEDMWFGIDSSLGHQSYYRQSDGWQEQRNGQCVALRSDGDRCNRMMIADGQGFCHFHFPRLIEWIAEHHSKRVISLARRHQYNPFDYSIESARIDDAMAILEAEATQVYFIALGDIVKIGYSKSVLTRFDSIRHGGKTKMPAGYAVKEAVLLGAIPGGPSVESKLHFLLGRFRLEGEWFALAPAVIESINYLLYGGEPSADVSDALREWFEGNYADGAYFFPTEDEAVA